MNGPVFTCHGHGCEYVGTRTLYGLANATTLAFAAAIALAVAVWALARHAEHAADRGRLTWWTFAVLWTAARLDFRTSRADSGVLDVAALPALPESAPKLAEVAARPRRFKRKGGRR